MLLNENLFETLNEETSDRSKVGGKEIAKQQAIKEMANLDFDVGHTFDPDDFDYFKKVCKEDGWNVTEEDFQKYFEYLDEIRSNQSDDEDYNDDIDLGDWEEMESKQVEDSDGFMTDYTWYVKDNDDGSETHIMIFGDQDMYTPMNSEPDAEFDSEDTAREWFDNYKGFAEDLDESILTEKENDPYAMSMQEAIKLIVDKFGNNKYQYQLKAEEYQRFGPGEIYTKKFFAPNDYLAYFSMRLHKAPTINNLEDMFDPAEVVELFEENDNIESIADYAQSSWWGDGDDYIISLDNLSTNKTLYASDYEPEAEEDDTYDWDEELEEAIKPNIESEELKALAQKHNIKILDAMSNGDLRMEGAGADLMKFYQEAEKLGLWEVSPELYEAKIFISKAEMDKLDKEVEEATKEVAQYNIKLKKLSDGSVELDFSETPEDQLEKAKAALDRYNKAIEARPDRAKDIITYTEALHGKEEINEFTALAKKLGFTTMAQMQHIMNAAKSLGKSELEMLKSVDETFDGKIPDTLIDGLTDEFLIIADDIGIETQEDYERFCSEEVEPGETITQAIKRYRDEIREIDENLLTEIAILNVNEPAIFDAIANAKAYIHEKKYSQAKDSLNYAANLLVEPMNESAMSNLDLEIKEAGGKKNWKEKVRKELADMIEHLEYLKTYAPKEVNAGGNYDSIEELQDDIEDLEKSINELNSKLDYVDSVTSGSDD